MIRDMMSPCMIAIIFLLIVLYFTYEPGSLPFLGGEGDETAGDQQGEDKEKKADDDAQRKQLVFDSADTDSDGLLSEDEFRNYKEETTYKKEKTERDEMINKINDKYDTEIMDNIDDEFGTSDKNDDDMLDIDEFKHNGGEAIDEEEYEDFKELHNHIHDVDDISEIDNRLDNIEDHLNMPHQFDEVDSNKDGMISKDEYNTAYKGGGSCSAFVKKYDELNIPQSGGEAHHDDLDDDEHDDDEHHKKIGGAMWGGLEAYDDNSGFASF